MNKMYTDILTDSLKDSKTWIEYKNKISAKIELDNLTKGKVFELFSKYFFLTDPRHKDNYSSVLLYEELSTEFKNTHTLNNIEHGIDLILKDNFDNYIAVQCKFKEDEDSNLTWTGDRIGNFFGQAFGRDFSKLIVITNASNITGEATIHKDKFEFISYNDLSSIDEQTLSNIYLAANKNVTKEIVKAEPRPIDQVGIIEKVTDYFSLEANSRGQLILPCGTGKTLISLWIKEKLEPKLTLVLLPSLSLLKQFKDEWAIHKNYKYTSIHICSDSSINHENDHIEIEPFEIGGNVATSSDKVEKFLNTDFKDNLNNSLSKVIFSTYQAIDVLINALQNTEVKIDLAICDEAHKTAGKKDGLFSKIHLDANINCAKRLYMTATPKVTSNNLNAKFRELLYDMDDLNIFGSEIFRMSFLEAINNEVLVDYKIIAVGVTDKQVNEFIRNRNYISEKTSIDEIANNYALEYVMNEYNASHSITFHSTIKSANQFSERHKKLTENLYCNSVSGKQRTNERAKILNEFKLSSKAVISNARCLTEGVNVPTIDLVYFCDPKKSKIDIVQATGRALRKGKNKTQGYVVVPIFHNSEDQLNTIIENGSFKNLISVIKSLSDHDKRIVEEINQIKLGRGRRQNEICVNSSNNEVSEILIIKGFEDTLRNSLFTQLIDTTSRQLFTENDWVNLIKEAIEDDSFTITINQSCCYPSSENGRSIGTFLKDLRKDFKNNKRIELYRHLEKLGVDFKDGQRNNFTDANSRVKKLIQDLSSSKNPIELDYTKKKNRLVSKIPNIEKEISDDLKNEISTVWRLRFEKEFKWRVRKTTEQLINEWREHRESTGNWVQTSNLQNSNSSLYMFIYRRKNGEQSMDDILDYFDNNEKNELRNERFPI